MRVLLERLRQTRLVRFPLVVSIVGFVLAGALAIVAVEERAFRAQLSEQLEARGAAALVGVDHRLQQRRRDHETFARLLAATPGLVGATRRRDATALRGMLEPIRANQAFQEITIYDQDGGEILELGRAQRDRIDASLFGAGAAGRTDSLAEVTAAGLVVVAATPIRSHDRLEGVLLVATTMGDRELEGLEPVEGAELALFQNGSFVASSARSRDVLRVIRSVR